MHSRRLLFSLCKGFRPDGKSAATVLPAAFGLAGVHLHTYAGWGSVPYWNAYVANTHMIGAETFFDPHIKTTAKFPVCVKVGFDNVRRTPDRVTEKLAPLHFYQLALPPASPKRDYYDNAAAKRGEAVFTGKARCASCHDPPLLTEPGCGMHTPEEIGIDDFQAKRSPRRHAPHDTATRSLRAREGGFYHDGRFATYRAVIDHYDRHFSSR